MGNNEKNFEYFTNLKYYIVVRKVKDKFVLYIHELSLLVEDESLERAYEKLESEKGRYFQKMIEMEAQNNITEPACFGGGEKTIKLINQLQNSLVPFSIKLIVTIITTIIIAFFVVNMDSISSTIKSIRSASSNIANTDFSKTLDVDQTIVKAIEALDKYEIAKKERERLSEIAKEERKQLSKYKLLTPVDVYASNNLADYPAKLAFDSKLGTFWHSSENEAYLVVSFNLPTKLYALSITSRADLPGLQGPEHILIEGSNDNKNWEHIYEASQLVWGQGETKRIFLGSNNRDYIYYKFNFARMKKDDFLSIVKMKLYSNSVVDVKNSSINENDASLWEGK